MSLNIAEKSRNNSDNEKQTMEASGEIAFKRLAVTVEHVLVTHRSGV